LITFILGIVRFQFNIFNKNRGKVWVNSNTKIDLLVLLLAGIPPLIAAISSVTLYNGWRHFYFIYPFLAYFGVRFFSKSSRIHMQRFQVTILILMIYTFSSTAAWMYSNRPLQNLYFNQLAGTDLEKRWELDYWSLSNRQALDWILSRDSRKQISIQTTDNSPLYDSAVFMSGDDIGRVNFLWFSKGIETADYVIARQDLTPESKTLRTALNLQEGEFHLVYKKFVGRAEIFSIYAKK
jgi:hypothetical protein